MKSTKLQVISSFYRGIILKEVFPLEKAIGMELYSTTTDGIGGSIKSRFEDFIVEEIFPDMSLLEVDRTLLDTISPIDQTVDGDPTRARFIHLAVQKMGFNTMDVASLLGSLLRLPRHLVSYAGLKDKRAVTIQRMSIPKNALAELRELELSRIWIRKLEYARHQVQIGELWGNKFTILVKESEVPNDEALHIAETIRKTPLLNYFGVQRFGVVRPFTHLVGKALLKKDYAAAIKFILTSTSEYESETLKELRIELSKEEIDPLIVDQLPKDLKHERTIALHLSKHPGEYERAFSKISPRLQALFIHSYQSYLFNKNLSNRVRNGLSLVIPDIGDFLMRLDKPHTGRDEWLFVTERNLEEQKELVRDGQYGIAAVIPGYSTKQPNTKQTESMLELLKDEEISLQDFYHPKNRNLDSAGGLHLVNITLPNISAEIKDDGLLVQFSLRKGSYATVVLREIMKNHPIHRS